MSNGLETVFGAHPKLYSRLLEILGSSSKVDVSVVKFNVDSKAADLDLFLKFDDIPVNLQKVGKDFLRLKLCMPEFVLNVSAKKEGMESGALMSITERDMLFVLGSFQYSFSCDEVLFQGAETSSVYEPDIFE